MKMIEAKTNTKKKNFYSKEGGMLLKKWSMVESLLLYVVAGADQK